MADVFESRFQELERIREIVNDPAHLQFLEVAPDKVNSEEIRYDRTGRLKAWKHLENAVQSIDDIRNNRTGLAFVGVLGHFTSGKSSLINALLEIGKDETPGYKRKVGPHPTDKSITLICHQDKRDVLARNTLSSIENIQIVHGPRLHFLEDIVLVDTPGLGDSEAEYDLAERFLHLCHVIIITVDGMVPFADTASDFELLSKAINKLGDVPKIFAVTKSMNFLTHRKGDYATDWDGSKADAFWDEAKARIASDPRFKSAAHDLGTIPVVFVDSVDGYNIEKLKNTFIPVTTDPGQRSRIYRAQVNYITEVAKTALLTFRKHLDVRLQNLDILYKEAKRKATEAQSILTRQQIAVDTAVKTANEKLTKCQEAIAFHNEQFAAPDPDKEVLLERFDDFERSVGILAKSAGQLQMHAIGKARSQVRSQIDRSFRVLGVHDRRLKAEIVRDCADDFHEDLDGKQIGEICDALNYYFIANVENLARNLTVRRNSELLVLLSMDAKLAFGEVVQTMSGGLGQFVESYNTAVKAFVAYLAQPNSRQLLAEYGLILFDDNEEMAVRAVELEIAHLPSWSTFRGSVHAAQEALSRNEEDQREALREIESLEFSGIASEWLTSGTELSRLCSDAVMADRLDVSLDHLIGNIESVYAQAMKELDEVKDKCRQEIKEIWLEPISKLTTQHELMNIISACYV